MEPLYAEDLTTDRLRGELLGLGSSGRDTGTARAREPRVGGAGARLDAVPSRRLVAGRRGADEEVLFGEFMKVVCGDGNYPGSVAGSPNWPGIAPGDRGGQNAMSPRYCDTSAFAEIGQTRAMLDRYTANGGSYREVVLDGIGHGAVIECPDDVARLLAEHLSLREDA